MGKGRLEAFSDGVIAIILTIMVLEMVVPMGGDLASLRPVLPAFVSYVLSFLLIGIYWNNHHHLLHAAREVDGRILWANLHLLFWLSLVPFVTHWMGTNHFAAVPVALYGIVCMFAGTAYYILERQLIRHHGEDSNLARAVGRDVKGKLSMGIYAIAVLLSFSNRWLAVGAYFAVAAMWLIPDRRIERVLTT